MWLGFAFTAFSAWLHRDRPARRIALAAALVALCWASQLVTDAWFTRYPVYSLWPLTRDAKLMFAGGVWLGAPINHWPSTAPSPWPSRSGPGRRSPRSTSCGRGSTGSRATNQACDGCGGAVCLGHARVSVACRPWSCFRVDCPACAGAASNSAAGAGGGEPLVDDQGREVGHAEERRELAEGEAPAGLAPDDGDGGAALEGAHEARQE